MPSARQLVFIRIHGCSMRFRLSIDSGTPSMPNDTCCGPLSTGYARGSSFLPQREGCMGDDIRVCTVDTACELNRILLRPCSIATASLVVHVAFSLHTTSCMTLPLKSLSRVRLCFTWFFVCISFFPSQSHSRARSLSLSLCSIYMMRCAQLCRHSGSVCRALSRSQQS